MQVFRTFEEFARHSVKVCLAIGVFDGVHLGHQRVIGQARDDARAGGGKAIVLTFDPHPMRVLQPNKAPRLLTSTEHKLRLIDNLGVDGCLLLKFDKAFSLTPAEQFIDTVARHVHPLQEICVGTRFRFGHDRAGDVHLMEALAPQYGYAAKEIKSVKLDDEMISSTAIRQHVLQGHLDRAAAMLGRPFSILGTVEPGDRRGRELGFPTANLNPRDEVLPPDGVYAARAIIGAEQFGSVVNVGVRPTFAETEPRRVLEVHILDFARDLYGKTVEVVFLKKLRDEQKFTSVDALKAQIAADIQSARGLVPLPTPVGPGNGTA
ncbi:MAG TPA: bifunctional riboflavin kinase/FAD synthetase [Verrucomicrobiae bacterium]|nr:bifunctional riboflavin kinase/FAD synthetase [Verrucomicrobiae bacterium]